MAVFAVYWPAVQNGFVWDDTALVLRDPFIRSWRLVPAGFGHYLFTDATASNFYRPLQRLTYTLDYALYDFRPAGYHLTNILLQVAAAMALWLFARKLTGFWGSRVTEVCVFLACVAWAIHPLHSSAVIYVAGRADLLAAAFGFFGLYLVETALTGKRKLLCWGGAALCLLCAMLSKESGVIFPLISLVLFTGRKWAGPNQAAEWPVFSARGLRWWLTALFLVASFYCALRFTALEIPPPPGPRAPIAARPLLVARAWAEYTGLLLLPRNLHMERDLIPIYAGDMQKTVAEALLLGVSDAARLPPDRWFYPLVSLVVAGVSDGFPAPDGIRGRVPADQQPFLA